MRTRRKMLVKPALIWLIFSLGLLLSCHQKRVDRSGLQETLPSQMEGLFEEVSDAAGFTYEGKSYAHSWGDANGDGWPDLYASNHSKAARHSGEAPPYLYLNQQDGTFLRTELDYGDVSDIHGASWADFDNDGDQDLLVTSGGSSHNLFYVNAGTGKFEDVAMQWGLEFEDSRGRSPFWFDLDRDGRLDLLLPTQRPQSLLQNETAFFLQKKEEFVLYAGEKALGGILDGAAAVLGDLGGAGITDLILFGKGGIWRSTPDTSGIKSQSQLLNKKLAGLICGDWNGDLKSEMLCIPLPDIKMKMFSMLEKGVNYQNGKSFLIAGKLAGENAFSCRLIAECPVEFTLLSNQEEEEDSPLEAYLYLGNSGKHPDSLRFTYSEKEMAAFGLSEFSRDIPPGVYIGYDPAQSSWIIHFQPFPLGWKNMNIKKRLLLQLIPEDPEAVKSEFEPLDRLLESKDAFRFVDEKGLFTEQAFDIELGTCLVQGAVTADFDNDMDEDIYFSCSDLPDNMPNCLLENMGNGEFRVVPYAGGAAGSSRGVGSQAVVADYNRDGFMDLLVSNGNYSIGDGPDQLFRNKGNDNHWLEIDLEGIQSNRDGIGSILYLYSNGKAQMRIQSGGFHIRGQNHSRIHFGLARNTSADSLLIQWPSGIRQKVLQIPADQIIRICEQEGSQPWDSRQKACRE
jgi:hypothetical protein